MFSSPSPVPQALSLAWHAEAIPVVGEVTVKKQDKENQLVRWTDHTNCVL